MKSPNSVKKWTRRKSGTGENPNAQKKKGRRERVRKLDPLDVKDHKPKKFLTWDIETIKWTRFLVAGVWNGECFEFFTSLHGMVNRLFDNHSGYHCFSHFGGIYDHLFLIKEFLEVGKEHGWVLEEMIPRGSGILCFDLKRGEDILHFRDSSALLPFSLKSITENFKVSHAKKEIDYEKITKITPELLEYLEYDVRGLYESLRKFESSELIQQAGMKFTIASQSVQVLRLYLKKPIRALSKTTDKGVRRAYFGGRTEIFRSLYKGTDPLYCYDVNSIYPYVMRENEFPGALRGRVREYVRGEMGVYYCKVDVPECHIPPLGVVHRKKYIFPTGKFYGWFCTPEIDYAKSLGVSVKPIRGYLFGNGGSIFRKFVDTLYSIRKRAERGSVDEVVAKLLLNSCYGRFGLRRDREQVVFDDFSEGLVFLRELEVGNETYRLMRKKVELESFTNVAIAAFVTSYARIYIHGFMNQCGKDLYYTDTDSLFTTKQLPTGGELGQLKKEDEYFDACFLLPKTYIAGKKVVMKGFDKKKIQHFTIQDFQSHLEGDQIRLRIQEPSRFAKFKTAIRMGNLTSMVEGSSREIRSQYDKRIRIDFETKPIMLNEWS